MKRSPGGPVQVELYDLFSLILFIFPSLFFSFPFSFFSAAKKDLARGATKKQRDKRHAFGISEN
jgi:hypothetical protein